LIRADHSAYFKSIKRPLDLIIASHLKGLKEVQVGGPSRDKSRLIRTCGDHLKLSWRLSTISIRRLSMLIIWRRRILPFPLLQTKRGSNLYMCMISCGIEWEKWSRISWDCHRNKNLPDRRSQYASKLQDFSFQASTKAEKNTILNYSSAKEWTSKVSLKSFQTWWSSIDSREWIKRVSYRAFQILKDKILPFRKFKVWCKVKIFMFLLMSLSFPPILSCFLMTE